MDKGTRGAGSELFFRRKHLYASRVEEYDERETEEVRRGSSVHVQKYKGQEKVVLVGAFNSRIGKASNPVRTMDNMGK